MDEDAIIGMAEKLFEHAEDVAELSPTIESFIQNVKEKKPQIAMGLGIAAKMCK